MSLLLSGPMMKLPAGGGGGGLTFVGSEIAIQNNGDTLSFTTPAGVADGDRLVVTIMVYDGTTVNTPTGWSLKRNDGNIWTFERVASSQPGTQNFTLAVFKEWGGIFTVWRNAQIGNTGYANGFGTSRASQSITVLSGSAVMHFWGAYFPITLPGAGTALENGRADDYVAVAAEYEAGLSAGSTTARTATTTTADQIYCYSIEIRAT